MILKRRVIFTLLTTLLAIGCGGTKSNNKSDKSKDLASTPKREITIAKLYDYRVVAEYPHSSKSYTQGLQYVDGVMWEGTGREGRSHLQTIDLKTGKVNILASLPNNEFGEGITHLNGRIYQLTWESNKAYVYDNKGNFLKNLSYRGEGWGITTDGEHLYMSDGSSTIRRIDPETFSTEESICVTLNGEPLDLLNELEWVDGHIWANVYLTDAIVEIDPKTGVIIGFIDLPELRSRLHNNPEAEALNGVAYNSQTGNFYVAGKDWNRIFEIEIIR